MFQMIITGIVAGIVKANGTINPHLSQLYSRVVTECCGIHLMIDDGKVCIVAGEDVYRIR